MSSLLHALGLAGKTPIISKSLQFEGLTLRLACDDELLFGDLDLFWGLARA